MSNSVSRKKIAIQLTLAITLIVLAVIAKRAIANEPVQSVSQGSITQERAAELTHMLRHDCGSCHGMTLKGGLGPSLLPEQFKDKNSEYITLTILHGRSGTAMPPWKTIISEDDARWIAEFLLSGRIKEFNK